MTHNRRCEVSKSKREKCRCSCHGDYHGILNPADEVRWNEFFYHVLTEQDGGEVAEFIRENKGKEYYCMGNHTGGVNAIHRADVFYGYEHDAGLADRNGKRWWVYVLCAEPPKDGFEYQTSFAHFPGAVEKAKIEMEWEKEAVA